jgi:hypothetical protein
LVDGDCETTTTWWYGDENMDNPTAMYTVYPYVYIYVCLMCTLIIMKIVKLVTIHWCYY